MRTNSGVGDNRKRLRWLLVVTVVVTFWVIGYLVTIVRAELSELSTASSDNVQWNLSQAEVEHLAFLSELQKVQATNAPDLKQLRRRFDVFYSRITTLTRGAIYADIFLSDTESAQSLDRLRTFLDETAELIDGPDGTLIAELPSITENAVSARQDVRVIALEGITHFANLRDINRGEVYRTLASIALLTTGLLMLLLALVFLLNRLNKTSHRRMVQNELANARMSAIVGTSLDAIIAVDHVGKVLEFNGAAEDIFGYTRSEAIGAVMSDLIVPDHLHAAHEAGMERYQKTGEKRVVGQGRVRLEAKRKNGEVFPVELNINEVPSTEDSIYISYLRDISKEVEAEDELRTARDAAVAGEKSKSRLLAVMSHEMRTPLNGLLGTMELLSDTTLTDHQSHYLRIMEKSGKLLLSHVNDVLDISRLDADKMDIDSSVFDLNTMIGEVLDGQRVLAKNKGNSLTFTPLEDGQILVSGDQQRLRQVLLNLVGNAIKFTRNGDVNVETERLNHKNLIEIRVTDTGVGIASEDLNRIFEDFTTLDSSYGRKSEGTGLGLGITRRITHAMGGEIGVESELGEGSLFWVRIPIELSDDENQPGTKKDVEPAVTEIVSPIAPLNILLVEDNEINRMVARDFLEADGHHVSEAHDGSEGVAFAERQVFDLILMDISMPEIDGVEATAAIRNGDGKSRGAPIFALTAHALEEDVQQFHEAGMTRVISKPVSRRSLRAAVGSLKQGFTLQIQHGKQSESLVDTQVFNEFRTDLGEERFFEMYHKFIHEMDDTLAKLAQSHDGKESNRLDVARTAHRLAGSAAMFGAFDLRQVLMNLESYAKAQQGADHDDQIQTAIGIWGNTRALLDQLV